MEFTGLSLIEFTETFKSDLDCKEYLGERKWGEGFRCRKCNHKRATILKGERTAHRMCTLCKREESPTSGTLFHRVRFGLRKAFFIVYEMSTSSKGLSSIQMANRYGISQKTAWYFMRKVRLAMESSGNHPMRGKVQVDEFTVGGKEKGKKGRSYDSKKKKIVGAVELTDANKIKRFYALPIDNYSGKELEAIFKNHIAVEAKVETDGWKGYNKMKKKYHIKSTKSMPGINFNEIHTVIQNLKSWLRAIPTHISKEHTKAYLDEFCYRLNRSIHKETIFEGLINRMIVHPPVKYQNLKLCN